MRGQTFCWLLKRAFLEKVLVLQQHMHIFDFVFDLITKNEREDKLLCSTSRPGGNQVDGLPPAASLQSDLRVTL